MGFLLSKFLWTSEPEDYDVEDSRTGLTPRQINIVRDTWEIVKKDVKGNGVELFLKFFDKHPEAQVLFKAFANVPRDKLRTNGRLLGHATSVMYALTSLVDNLGDYDCLSELLIKIGLNHIPRNVTEQHFQSLTFVILELMTEKLGHKLMDEAAIEAWKKTLDVANSVIMSEIDKGRNQ